MEASNRENQDITTRSNDIKNKNDLSKNNNHSEQNQEPEKKIKPEEGTNDDLSQGKQGETVKVDKIFNEGTKENQKNGNGKKVTKPKKKLLGLNKKPKPSRISIMNKNIKNAAMKKFQTIKGIMKIMQLYRSST